MDLDKSTSTSASLKKLQEEGALPGYGTMERKPGGTEPEPVLGRMVAVEDYILCGFLPPPSEFFLLVLNFYGLSVLHLNPNSIAFLSIFSHICEAYIGVEPFLDLFRFYYELRWMEPKKVSGCVGFGLRDGLKSRYIPFQCPSSRSKWRARWFYLQIENSDAVFVVPEEQPDKIPSWTAKPALTPSLQSFIDIIDDLGVRGLSGYEVAADFIGRRIQPLQARAHPAFDYSGPEDETRVSPRGLNSETVEHRVGQVMVSGPTTASNVPAPLCEKGAAEREAAINALPLTNVIGPLVDHQAAALLKEGVAQEASDVAIAAAAATTSCGNVPRKGRKFSSVLGNRQKTPTPSQRLVILGEKSREVTPSSPASDLVPARGPPADVLTWEELHVEMGRILEAGARSIGREIAEARAVAASSAKERADKLARDLAEVRKDLQKMRELGLENRMSELENNLSEIRVSLRVTYTGLHQLAGECGVTTTIPANPDEFSLTTSLAELATAMEAISRHAARIGEEKSNRIYTGMCHVLAILIPSTLLLCVEMSMSRMSSSAGSLSCLYSCRHFALEPYVPQDVVDQNLPVETGMAMTSLVKKDRAVEALRGREVWFNSYLRSCCTAMAGVCKELRVPRGYPKEFAAGYISWLNGAYAQLEGIGKHIDEALKQECRRSSRYAGGHVLACIRDHRPQLHLEFLHEGFARSRRTPAEIDQLAKSMAPLAEKVFQSMDWRWPSW
uniref:Transposase (putative) gypsy type domain-containing protein n=1 Tax=Oryza sativa subsp. japonica TaxID=39947 RepID=Q6AT76_ORYSJ|nr:hypothetical protein [Oryza sativa Japonica Group]